MNLKDKILKNLSPDLLKKGYEGSHPLSGHCYVASEAYYHLSGEKLTPHTVKHEGVTHWYLIDKNGEIIDLTKEQFETSPDYTKGRGRGFLTKRPSKRALILMERIND